MRNLNVILLMLLSAFMLSAMAVTIFDVPIKGSIPAFTISLVLYSMCATGVGLLASSVTRSQIAVIFMTMLGTMIPAVQFCGMIDPVTAQEGGGRIIGMIYPTTYMLLISRGVFNKALGFADLYPELLILLVTVPIVIGCGILSLRKQEK